MKVLHLPCLSNCTKSSLKILMGNKKLRAVKRQLEMYLNPKAMKARVGRK